ncbi:MAG: hypothetical protein F2607_04200 [Actinobacteria bacterium]|uniref:Unannotated protein n=2 Tax=freshwater metagenome TaxID=449393 RepID=A0A6J6J648_9ZZZZ|nr:hypothetical protein [Actinomycetota bacterium]
MTGSSPTSAKRPRWWLVALAVVLLLAIAGGGSAVVVRMGTGNPRDFAASSEAEGLSVPSQAVAQVASGPVLTDYVSPENPSAVGIAVMTFTDLTRTTPARGDRETLTTRPLTVVVRYPTVGMPGTDEFVDAPAYAPAPLVLFAHGFDISTDRYASLLHEIASAGFVVAAPEFPMSSTVYNGAPDEYDIPEQARDLSFLISAMTGPDAPTALREMIAPGPVGVIGHSDGAVTALLAAYAPRYEDSRIAAVVAISGDFDTFGGEWFTSNDPPLLAIHGEYDEINPFESSELLVGNDPGQAMLVAVLGASHLGSATDPNTVPSVARLIAYDFLWRLGGSGSAKVATYEIASTPPLELVTVHD